MAVQIMDLCQLRLGVVSPSTWILEVSVDRFNKEPQKITEYLNEHLLEAKATI
jgi:hypothetical protein